MVRGAEQLIKFKHEAAEMFIAPIVPASNALPEWYKNMSYTTKDSEPWDVIGKVKACMPFFDAMTQGYIIPLWADIYVWPPIKSGEEQPVFGWGKVKSSGQSSGQSSPLIQSHLPEQTEGMPAVDKALGTKMTFKFLSPWVIETPKGYSTLLVSPLNNPNPKLDMISAIVATDVYPTRINLPFVWTGPPDWEGVISQGTPLIQLIPFKRDNFRHEIEMMSEGDTQREDASLRAMGHRFQNAYKQLYRKITRSI